MSRRSLVNGAKWVPLLATILVLAFTCCDDNVIIEYPLGILQGIVIDSISSEPLESALVSFADTSRITAWSDSAGHYICAPAISAVDESVFCVKEGYLRQVKTCNIRSGETTTVDFRLIPLE